jgi:hypothetical protein
MRGSVALKLNERQGEVCLGENEVKAGDRVLLFKNDCTHRAPVLVPGRRLIPLSPYDWVTAVPVCHKAEVGGGSIVRTLNEHYSVVEVDPGVPITAGLTVEKK